MNNSDLGALGLNLGSTGTLGSGAVGTVGQRNSNHKLPPSSHGRAFGGAAKGILGGNTFVSKAQKETSFYNPTAFGR